MSRFLISIITLALLLCVAHAQNDSIKLNSHQILLIGDSAIVAEKDTILYLPKNTKYQIVDNKYVVNKDFYNRVYTRAQRNRVTRELYELLITERPPTEPLEQKAPVKSESFFEAFKGKTIRNIEFHSVDLFAGNVNDTTIKSRSRIGKLSNRLHNDTKIQIIQNHLLFTTGNRVHPFDLADSERIIRSLPYIEDVRIKLLINPEDVETVDALIIYKDRFPWSLNLSLDSNNALQIGFTNRNILGSGNELGIDYFYSRRQPPNHGYRLSYTKRNINNTFIDGTLYTSDNYLGKNLGISFTRDFVSPKIKYYGEVTVERAQPIENLVFADSLYNENFQSDRISYDVWSGRGFRIGERDNINFAVRLQHDHYAERPIVKADSNEFYHNHHLLLGALSYSKITYLKTRNILSFNITEDIPEGFLFSILYGRDWNEFDPRTYRGIRANYSNYTDYGYFNVDLEAGFFRNMGIRRNEVIEISTRYFSPLIEFGSAYSRIYSRLYFFNGDNLSVPFSETAAGANRIRNLAGNQIRGERITAFSTDMVLFQPWYWYGFRFAPYLHTAVGRVKESRANTPYRRTYSSAGLGIRIRNESLVFDTFDFRIAFFPNSPTDSNSLYFRFSISSPVLFGSPNIRKPRVVGINF